MTFIRSNVKLDKVSSQCSAVIIGVKMWFHLFPVFIILIFQTNQIQAGYGSGQGIEVSTVGSYSGSTQHNISGWPYFEYNVPRNVTAAVGQTAFLHCRVEQLGDKAVSWIRKRDLHILTAGILTYTSDQRFQVIRPDKSENWTLQIKFPQERDSGIYECQVNTEPKMSLSYRLNVVEARARISGPDDVYVKTGSLLTLTCLMSQGPHDLGTVAWYHGSHPVLTSPLQEGNDVASVPRVAVDTEWSDALTSRLKITHARPSDSGNYSCVPTVAESASVNVHVINGEHPAAMQHGNTAAGSPTSRIILVAVVFLLGQLR
ncbi:zwei Ig domain protein zig-8 isoform X1 [Neodiprion virginianus]|uniref:zwei Ig domain protein zig-8 isoform X1 n=1 Tax=Neodiprion fabricii TaxID=2872261 RepID=UPI001ED9780E|nr:zwei Ig domain protein zig-8 isoform X1 [Neodiprion fabricii]XP_046434149.1 zwei Ig domain protein zig-8 isoform X1 [Neodiprion fabricii]XP_046627185.1 zwei Ig domain protein zig-8 isoform X1 [Neodiprion virginianus]